MTREEGETCILWERWTWGRNKPQKWNDGDELCAVYVEWREEVGRRI